MTPNENTQAEREAFETWANDQGFLLQRTALGDDYQDLRTQGPWDAWQARAALSAPPSVSKNIANCIAQWGLPEGYLDAFMKGAAKPALATPLAAVASEQEVQAAVGRFAIDVEKRLCAKLGRTWSASGISIESLIDALAASSAAVAQPVAFWIDGRSAADVKETSMLYNVKIYAKANGDPHLVPVYLAASPSCEQSAAHAAAEALDVCTDSDNCTRCKTARKFRGDTEHAGIPVGNSFGAKGAAS